MRKALVALLLALTPAVCHGQGLYNLGFTLHGEPGPGWVETPLGVQTELTVMLWLLTLRGVVPVAEVLRERLTA